MNKKLIICLGPICSGKTTWSLKHVRQNPDCIRFCYDEFNYMCFGMGTYRGEEISNLVVQTLCTMVSLNKTLIIDGFPLIYEDIMEVMSFSKETEIRLFDIILSESLARNKQRRDNGGSYITPHGLKEYRDNYVKFISDAKFKPIRNNASIIINDFCEVNKCLII